MPQHEAISRGGRLVERCSSQKSLALALAVILGLLFAAQPGARPRPVVVWFTPGPGTLDMLRLFERGDEWVTARQRMSVFKFYQGQLLEPTDPIFGPNSYSALRGVDAFRTLSQVWHKRIAIEVGAVKEQYCTDDASGTNRAVVDTLNAIAAVREAGGQVAYLAIDEPFAATLLSPKCGGSDIGPTLVRLQRYFANVLLAAPDVRIGLIEQYPISSADQIADYVRQMVKRGIRPAFFHLDADLNALPKGSDRFEREIPGLADAVEAERVPFGIIFFGHSGDSDALYYQDVLQYARRAKAAFPQLPRDVIFQSWAVSKTGLRITPTNLPETGANTHTALINAALAILTPPTGS